MRKLINARLQALFIVVVVFLSSATHSDSKDDSLLVQGAVVAIQRTKTDMRLIEPESFADMAEIYMVRADRRSLRTRNEKYILIEYVHHTGLIGYEQFDKTRWIFKLHPQSPETNQECLSWIATEADGQLTFMPTAFGAKSKLPDPRTLSCFFGYAATYLRSLENSNPEYFLICRVTGNLSVRAYGPRNFIKAVQCESAASIP